MGLRVLGRLRELPSLAVADWRRSAPEAAVTGATARLALVGCALVAGAALGYASLFLAASWLWRLWARTAALGAGGEVVADELVGALGPIAEQRPGLADR